MINSEPKALLSALTTYWENANEVASSSGGVGLLTFLDMMVMRGVLDIDSERYVMYGMQNKKWQERREYISKSYLEEMQGEVNSPSGQRLADCKLAFYRRCVSEKVPTPKVVAVVPSERGGEVDLRSSHSIEVIRTVDALLDLLASMKGRRVVAKTVGGAYGKGLKILMQDAGGRITINGVDSSKDEVARCYSSWASSQRGYIIQEYVEAHRALRGVMPGRALGTFRFVTFRRSNGVKIEYAFAKLPVEGNVSDNFRHGSTGNLIADVDAQQGFIGTAWRMSKEGELAKADWHPNTGVRLAGYPIPCWKEACRVVEKAASSFPELHTAGWDVAIADDGIYVLEANWRYDPDFPQITAARGIRREMELKFRRA